MSRPHSDQALYVSPNDVFRVERPPVPAHAFEAERLRALNPATPTGFIPLDIGPVLGLGYPATTPAMLSRYAVIQKGETLPSRFRASGEFYYVIKGAGHSRNGADEIEWSEGDAFTFAGGRETVHQASAGPAILYIGTDEPALAFGHLNPPQPTEAATRTVLYPAERIEAEIAAVYAREPEADQAGMAIWLSSESGKTYGTFVPPMIAAISTLGAGCTQRPHRHNAVAVVLSLQGENCQTIVDGIGVDWQPSLVMITPPAAVHSIENRGSRMMRCLIFQDAGLYFHLGPTGFKFEN